MHHNHYHHHHQKHQHNHNQQQQQQQQQQEQLQHQQQQQQQQHQQYHRRRKKRPNYGTRAVDVVRGINGFGFTISGQQPCILSCVVKNSPADLAGLRAGDFLLSVNGANVSKLPHDNIVQIIGNSEGTIHMQIAENYYSDSSDEDIVNNNNNSSNSSSNNIIGNGTTMNGCLGGGGGGGVANNNINNMVNYGGNQSSTSLLHASNPHPRIRSRTKHPNHKFKMNRQNHINVKQQNQQQIKLIKSAPIVNSDEDFIHSHGNTHGNNELFSKKCNPYPLSTTTAHNIIHSPNARNTRDISNVSAMIRKLDTENNNPLQQQQQPYEQLEYRVIVGYLGTIEMPKQIATSTKFQTVRSCIRKMRQEKRNPTLVLMTILPTHLTLHNQSKELLAKYPAQRLNFISNNTDCDNRFFGLVTSTIYSSNEHLYEATSTTGGGGDDVDAIQQRHSDVIISSSCHVFVIDTKLITHSNHTEKSLEFQILCTRDPITNLCLEFPSNSEYVVNLIRSMYTLKSSTLGGGGGGVDGSINDSIKSLSIARQLKMLGPINRRGPYDGGGMIAADMAAVGGIQEGNAIGVPPLLEDNELLANSPQPSNHSGEITTSSNSDSGIGFHNDFTNISDRILVVDFPVNLQYRGNNNINNNNNNNEINDNEVQMPMRYNNYRYNDSVQNENFARIQRLNVNDDLSLQNNKFVDDFKLNLRVMPRKSMTPMVQKQDTINCNEKSISSSSAAAAVKTIPSSPVSRTTIESSSALTLTCNNICDRMPDLIDNCSYYRQNQNVQLSGARSCDDMLMNGITSTAKFKSPTSATKIARELTSRRISNQFQTQNLKMSIDDITMLGSNYSNNIIDVDVDDDATDYKLTKTTKSKQNIMDDHIFLIPKSKPFKKSTTFKLIPAKKLHSSDDNLLTSSNGIINNRRKSTNSTVTTTKLYDNNNYNHNNNNNNSNDKLLKYKLCPKVFGVSRPSDINNTLKTTSKQLLTSSASVEYLHECNNDSITTGGGCGGASSMENLYSSSRRSNDGLVDKQLSCDQTQSMNYENSNITLWSSLQELSRTDNNYRYQNEQHQQFYNHFLEGTYSEPDLWSRDLSSSTTNAGIGTDPNNIHNHDNMSAFRRWGQSSFRSRSNESRQPLQRRPSSLTASENDVYTKSSSSTINNINNNQENQRNDLTSSTTKQTKIGVSSWVSSFEKLLEDPSGLHTFAEFLKKEFSAENIYFWASCERYRQLTDGVERSQEALIIFNKHLCVGAPEPVNIDSHARTTAQDNIQKADKDLFMHAQKQIFNLMKFDSYQRFIRSDLYKKCLEAESKNQKLPYPGDQLDVGLKTGLLSPITNKLKKSLSNAEDRRRKSLLPWHRKIRCKSKDRIDDQQQQRQQQQQQQQSQPSQNKLTNCGGTLLKATNSFSDIHSSRSSLSSFDAAISSRTNESDEIKSSLCRVLLSDGATTIVQTRSNESVRDLVERLLEKRGIFYQSYEGFIVGGNNNDGCSNNINNNNNSNIGSTTVCGSNGALSNSSSSNNSNNCNKPIDLDGASSMLAGKEILIEQRVIFKLDLPNRKIICVKSKPCKSLGDVLRAILHKYNYRLELVQVISRETAEPLNMSVPVTAADGQRLHVITNDMQNGNAYPIITAKQIQQQQQLMRQQRVMMPPAPPPPAASSSSSHLPKPQIPKSSIHLPNQHFHHPASNNHHLQQQQQQKLAISNNTNTSNNNNNHQQTTLDEITNKVFNELLQGKVDSQQQPQLTTTSNNDHAPQSHQSSGLLQRQQSADRESRKSNDDDDDWKSEKSLDTFERLPPHRNSKNMNIYKYKKPIMQLPITTPSSSSSSSSILIAGQQQKMTNVTTNGVSLIGGQNIENIDNATATTTAANDGNCHQLQIKKPLIAKWKAGVKLQVPTRSENHDLLEGLKRAQRSRLEDQRGTEINFELPDFLKNRDNGDSNIKFGRSRMPAGATAAVSSNDDPIPMQRNNLDNSLMSTTNASLLQKPQPAVRLSLTKNQLKNNSSVLGYLDTNENNCDLSPTIENNNPSEYSNNHMERVNHSVLDVVDENVIDEQQQNHQEIIVIEDDDDDDDGDYEGEDVIEIEDDEDSNNSHHDLKSSFQRGVNIKNNSINSSRNSSTKSNSSSNSTNIANGNVDSTETVGLSAAAVVAPPPPPLPPKPKVLPIKPSNWGQLSGGKGHITFDKSPSSSSMASNRRNCNSINKSTNSTAELNKQRNVYLDQPSSSFV